MEKVDPSIEAAENREPQAIDIPNRNQRGDERALKEIVADSFKEDVFPDVCLNCGICASGCPASGVEGMDPRRFVQMLSLGMDKDILESDWVWICTTCGSCRALCPMDIDIPQLVSLVRREWPRHKKPLKMAAYCHGILEAHRESSTGLTVSDWHFVMEDVIDQIRAAEKGFEGITRRIDEKGAVFFLNQNERVALNEPQEMGPLLKILHLAGVDYTYGSNGWAIDNCCSAFADSKQWEAVIRQKVDAVEKLGCPVLLSGECGQDYMAMRRGVERFDIPHSFRIESVLAYYAQWIRQGKLPVTGEWNRNLKIKFTVHDPCQIIRPFDIFEDERGACGEDGENNTSLTDALRYVVKKAVGEENYVEMCKNRAASYCCGGGNGGTLSDFVTAGRNYGKMKLEQILETKAEYCITPCCSCHKQILDLRDHYHASFNVIHLYTLLCLSMNVLGKNERKYLGDDLKHVGGSSRQWKPLSQVLSNSDVV